MPQMGWNPQNYVDCVATFLYIGPRWEPFTTTRIR